MTAKEFLNKMKVKDMGYIFSHHEDETPKERIDLSELMTDYLNSQRETIFKEELEKEYDSEKNKKLFEEEKGFYWAEFPETYAYWLIQYLKK